MNLFRFARLVEDLGEVDKDLWQLPCFDHGRLRLYRLTEDVINESILVIDIGQYLVQKCTHIVEDLAGV